MNDRSPTTREADAVLAIAERPHRLPAPLRVALALVVLLCAVAFLAMSGLMLVSLWSGPAPHPFIVGELVLFVGGLGGLCASVAWDLVRPSRGPGEIGPFVRRAFGLLFGAASIAQLGQAIADGSAVIAAQAIGGAWCAFLLLRSTMADPERSALFNSRVHKGLGALLCIGAFALAIEAFRTSGIGFALQGILAASCGSLILRSTVSPAASRNRSSELR